MLWRTHFIGGAIAGVLVNHSSLQCAVISGFIGGIGALLPDIDTPRSKIGHAVPILPTLFNFSLGHRGALHSFVGGALIATLGFGFIQQPYLHAFILGYISHLVLDALNPAGIPFAYPLTKKHFGLPLLRSGFFWEKLIVLPSLIIYLGILLKNIL